MLSSKTMTVADPNSIAQFQISPKSTTSVDFGFDVHYYYTTTLAVDAGSAVGIGVLLNV